MAQGLYWPAELREQPCVPDVPCSVTEIDIARQLVRSLRVDAIELAERDEYAQGLAALVEANEPLLDQR